MSWPHLDDLNRTAKMLVDSGRVSTLPDAVSILEGFVLQVEVGAGLERSSAAQAALATLINAGRRAFLGGVLVHCQDDPILTEGWVRGYRLSEAVALYGGETVDVCSRELPTVVVGEPVDVPVGRVVLWATWGGWSGGLVQDPRDRLSQDGMVLAGVIAGALGVSETFQLALGSPVAGRRDVGVSLWRPDLSWRDPKGTGPVLEWLPARLWLLGLGHLGQAYAWSIGWLPFAAPADVTVYLMDTDTVVPGNRYTGLLLHPSDIGRRKTRVVADYLEQRLEIRTSIVERKVDRNLWPIDDEPGLALAGFDDPTARRLLGGGRFDRVLDAGLGAGPVEYLDILLHTFPSQLDPATAFPQTSTRGPGIGPAYAAEVERMVEEEGAELGAATCGMTEVAGISVGAAFVGAAAGALVVGDVLRHFAAGMEVAVLSLDLRNPSYIDAGPNTSQGSYINTGATPAR